MACLAVAALLLPAAALPHAQVTTTVQFDREIVHILDDHCVMCHYGMGPAFPLLTYEQAYAARWKIRRDALDRHMAPWAAVPGYGAFANSNALTQREIDFLVSWAESFGPRNNGEVYTAAADASAAPKVVQAHFDPDRWALGSPDVRLVVAAKTIDLKLRSDRWLKALEYQPRDRRAVHSVRFTIQETGQWIGTWTPWRGFSALPRGLAYRLPAGSHLALDTLYYGPRPGPNRESGPAPADRSTGEGTLGLYFADQPSRQAVTSLILGAQPAGQSSPGKLVATTTLETDTTLLAIEPEVRPGLRSVEVSAQTSREPQQILLYAKAIPVDWPTSYIYSTPLALHKGARLTVIEHYDEGSAVPARAGAVTFNLCAGPP